MSLALLASRTACLGFCTSSLFVCSARSSFHSRIHDRLQVLAFRSFQRPASVTLDNPLDITPAMLSLRLALSGLLGAPLLALASPDLFLAKPGSQNHHRRHHGHIVHHPRPKHHPHRATTSGFIVRQATSSISARSSTSTTPARSSTSVVSTASSVGPVSARPPSLVSAAAAPPATTPVNPYLGNWNLSLIGNSGVSAQQLAVVDENHAIIYDKVETKSVSQICTRVFG